MARFGRGAEKKACRNAGAAAGDCPRDVSVQARAHPIFLRSRADCCQDDDCRDGARRSGREGRDSRVCPRDANRRGLKGRENCGAVRRKFSPCARNPDGCRCEIYAGGPRIRREAVKDHASRDVPACGKPRASLQIVREVLAGSKGRETRACRACALLCQNVFHLSTVTPGDRRSERDQSAAVFYKRRRQILQERAEQLGTWVEARMARKLFREVRNLFRARLLRFAASARRPAALRPSGEAKPLRRKRACDAARTRVFRVRFGPCARA